MKNTNTDGNDEGAHYHPCRQTEFNNIYHYSAVKKPGVYHSLKSHTRHFSLLKAICSLFPILKWLPSYQWKTDFSQDIVSGMTVAVMHIPQGMGYSSLAGVPPIVGIYMAFFPVLIYVLMGTSRHVSMGTFAVVCMMASKPVYAYSSVDEPSSFNGTALDITVTAAKTAATLSPVQVATVVSLVVGMWQVVLGVGRLGSLSVLMSDTLVSGFTTGAAVLVFTSQVKHVFGIKLPRYSGAFKVIYTYMDLINMIDQTNLVAFGISLAVIILLTLYNECLKQKLSKIPVPVPVELMAVIAGTLASCYYKLPEQYSVSIVGDIPTGFPEPKLPPLWLIPQVLVDGLVIAIVAFSVNISMASIFARKCNYEVDANQELLASGCGNVFGSFFCCLPFAASLSRSLIQQRVGGKTQLASVVSCSILVIVLLYIGPLFEPLPNCVLASIIIVALKGMLMQVKEFPVAWHQSSRDGIIWIVTFLSVVLLDIDVGLGVGLITSMGCILLMSQKPSIYCLGNVPQTDIYLELNRYHMAVCMPGVLVVHISGGMHFANKNTVKDKVLKILRKQLAAQKATEHAIIMNESHQEKAKEEGNNKHIYHRKEIHTLVLDMSAVGFVDPASAKALLALNAELASQDIQLFIAKCSGHVYETLSKCDFFATFSESHLFPTIHDAVLFAQQDNNN